VRDAKDTSDARRRVEANVAIPPLVPAFSPDPSDPPLTPAEGPFEQFGPLVLERLVKDDGRALIRFSRAVPADATLGDGAER
jgi:hypothetical protein